MPFNPQTTWKGTYQSFHSPQNTHPDTSILGIFGPFQSENRTKSPIFWLGGSSGHIRIILFNIFGQILTFLGLFADHFRQSTLWSTNIINYNSKWSKSVRILDHFRGFSPFGPKSEQKSDFLTGWKLCSSAVISCLSAVKLNL